MASVTQRIKEIRQPKGGYINPSELTCVKFNDDETLGEENIHSILMGLVVDYMTRFMRSHNANDAFSISLLGASVINKTTQAKDMLSRVKGLDDDSIFYACKLVGYDVCFRAGAEHYKPVEDINADKTTINNVRIMVNRSLAFFEKYGPVTCDGFTMEGGYTSTIDSGDGDFLTEDALWDFKVSKYPPKQAHTLQILVYYLMGIRSIHREFMSITKLGIFNPRLNAVYTIDISSIPAAIKREVGEKVIGYNTNFIKSKSPKPAQENDLLYMADLMRILNCSRHYIMKFYSENGLPLFKKGNKYCIHKADFAEWIEKRKKEETNKYIATAICISIVAVFFIVLFCLII